MKWETPKQHLRRLRVERFVTYLKTLSLVFCGTLALWVILAIMPNDGFIDRFNECLQKNSLDYCNQVIE